jgi:MerR family mercuric resistance operon transcriptional regulator
MFTNLRGGLIGGVSAQTGVNIETIRYYERIGLLPKPDRTSSGRRLYESSEVARLLFIRRARDLGFSIENIRTLLELTEPTHISCGEFKSVAVSHKQLIDRKIADLSRLSQILSVAISGCSGGDVPDCPVFDMLVTAD